MNLLLKTILSAIFFSFAFFYPNKLALLVIFSFIFLYKIFLTKKKLLEYLKLGFLWGIVAYGLHFIWLLELLISKFFINYFFIVLIYIFVVLYTAILTSCFFVLTKICINFFLNKFFKKFIFLLCLFFYFVFLTKYSICFLGQKEGYPFINPLLLFSQDINKKVFFLPNNFEKFGNFEKIKNNFYEKLLKNYKIFYLKPLNSFDKNLNSCRVGQHIYHELANLNLQKYKDKFENLIIVGPETTFPFFLNKNLDQIKLWDSVLPENTYLILGSQRYCEKNKEANLKEKIFQTVYFIHQGRIINFYDKKHCVQFTEKTPKVLKNYFKKLKITKEILKDKLEFSRSKLKTFKTFKISKNLKIIPIICSEFFFLNLNEIKKLKNKNINKNLIVLLFVNDSWFMPYFKKLMKNFVILTSYKLDLPILYIGWPEKI